MFGASRIGVPPQVNVWGTILFAGGLTAAALNLVASFRSTRKAERAMASAPRAVRSTSG